MTIENWGALVAALVILGLSPGPAWAAVITTSFGRGFCSAAILSLGIALGDIVFLLISVLGLGLLAELLGTFFLLVKFAGAAYLIWLGLRLWCHHPAIYDQVAPLLRRPYGLFAGGLMLTLGNPKVIAFYPGFLPAFIDMTALTWFGLVLLNVTTFVIIVSMAVWLCGTCGGG